MIDLQECNISKPENIKALFNKFLNFITKLYEEYTLEEIKNRLKIDYIVTKASIDDRTGN